MRASRSVLVLFAVYSIISYLTVFYHLILFHHIRYYCRASGSYRNFVVQLTSTDFTTMNKAGSFSAGDFNTNSLYGAPFWSNTASKDTCQPRLRSPNMPDAKDPAGANSTDSNNCLARIAYWSGKVNQHYESDGWKTDPDGTSGADLDPLKYCQKWYPSTTDYRQSESSSNKMFCTRGNQDCTHKNTKNTKTQTQYDCLYEMGLQNCDGSVHQDEESDFKISISQILPGLLICGVIFMVLNIRRRNMRRRQQQVQLHAEQLGQRNVQMQPMAQQPVVIGGSRQQQAAGAVVQPMVPTLPPMAVVKPLPVVQPMMLPYQQQQQYYQQGGGVAMPMQGYQQRTAVQPMVVQPMPMQPIGQPIGQLSYVQSGVVQPMAVPQPIPVPSADPYGN